MIKGERVALRPIRDDDWQLIEEWGRDREGLWGPFQRFQLDQIPLLLDAYDRTKLLTRSSGFLLIQAGRESRVVGFVRYSLVEFPDADLPYPEIGFGVDASSRCKGYAQEAVMLLVDYLFSGYPVERVAAFTDVENLPSQRVLEKLGFEREGVLRRSTFRDGRWCDLAMYSVLRSEWCAQKAIRPASKLIHVAV
jgi:RimJ/RimL family protein N-acetyltransferase